ncbi:MAG TPA: hypothetical protein VJC10_01195 [Patescibacteria group bacterium]|nr:hypothetical protein [Patescibacteria group bacterium]
MQTAIELPTRTIEHTKPNKSVIAITEFYLQSSLTLDQDIVEMSKKNKTLPYIFLLALQESRLADICPLPDEDRRKSRIAGINNAIQYWENVIQDESIYPSSILLEEAGVRLSILNERLKILTW